MLKTKLIQPDILETLASNGHGAKILIADANFPVGTHTPAGCKKVFLNLSPGVLTVTGVLEILKDYAPIESAILMTPPDGSAQPIHQEFRDMLGTEISFSCEKKAGFYSHAESVETCLVIATGETRRCGNIILVMGAVRIP